MRCGRSPAGSEAIMNGAQLQLALYEHVFPELSDEAFEDAIEVAVAPDPAAGPARACECESPWIDHDDELGPLWCCKCARRIADG
jgi:hypothetical protein